jgi:hypothetical protein
MKNCLEDKMQNNNIWWNACTFGTKMAETQKLF